MGMGNVKVECGRREECGDGGSGRMQDWNVVIAVVVVVVVGSESESGEFRVEFGGGEVECGNGMWWWWWEVRVENFSGGIRWW